MTTKSRISPSFVTVWVAAMWIVLALVVSCGDDDDDSVDDWDNSEICLSWSDEGGEGASSGMAKCDWDEWDDWDDEDNPVGECMDVIGMGVWECFPELDSWDICTSEEASCWVECFQKYYNQTNTQTCEKWRLCAVAGCAAPLGSAPVVNDGSWNPNPATDDGFGATVSTFSWSVCDIDNDLAGGQIFIWVTGQEAPLLANDIFWADFEPEMSDVANCDAPVSFGVTVDFTEAVPYGDDVCVDLEVTDGEGNLSNKLTNLCVFVP